MRRFLLISLAVVLAGSAWVWKAQADATIIGDYVEARTASVFAGACHYNGELVTAGSDALLAWNIQSGQWKGVNLAGVRAVAVISADANLSKEDAARRSELIVDEAATPAQLRAVTEALGARYAASLGKVVTVRQAPVTFRHQDKLFLVNAPGSMQLSVEALPNDECCKMPNLVWYNPFVQLETRKVGYTKTAEYAGGAAGPAWERKGENSAFYGRFSL